MRIGVLGTGMVGKSIGTKLVQIGHAQFQFSHPALETRAASYLSTSAFSAPPRLRRE